MAALTCHGATGAPAVESSAAMVWIIRLWLTPPVCRIHAGWPQRRRRVPWMFPKGAPAPRLQDDKVPGPTNLHWYVMLDDMGVCVETNTTFHHRHP